MSEMSDQVVLDLVTQFPDYPDELTYHNDYWFKIGNEREVLRGSNTYPTSGIDGQDCLFEIEIALSDDICIDQVEYQIVRHTERADDAKVTGKSISRILAGNGILGASVVMVVGIKEMQEDGYDPATLATVSLLGSALLVLSGAVAYWQHGRYKGEANKSFAKADRFQRIMEYLEADANNSNLP